MAYVNHFKEVCVVAIHGVGFYLLGNIKGVYWNRESEHWGRCGEDQCVGVSVDRNVAVMQNYL
jgi:hypothetical protein